MRSESSESADAAPLLLLALSPPRAAPLPDSGTPQHFKHARRASRAAVRGLRRRNGPALLVVRQGRHRPLLLQQGPPEARASPFSSLQEERELTQEPLQVWPAHKTVCGPGKAHPFAVVPLSEEELSWALGHLDTIEYDDEDTLRESVEGQSGTGESAEVRSRSLPARSHSSGNRLTQGMLYAGASTRAHRGRLSHELAADQARAPQRGPPRPSRPCCRV